MNRGFKGYFITGLLVVVPLYITIYVLALIVGFMDSTVNVLPRFLRPDTYLPFHIPGQGIVFTVLGVFIVGVLTANILGERLLRLTENLMARVPIVSVVYKSTKQLMETFFAKDHEGFRKVVLVQFPRKGVYSMGFVTGRARGELLDRTSRGMMSIFMPTTPNPTSGFYIIAREEDTVPLEMSVEDAFKVLMSGGMIVPDYRPGAEQGGPGQWDEGGQEGQGGQGGRDEGG
ncbi:MAG: DUF502 domain-containing protein [Thermodesulfobacteriota bacterium]